MARALKIFSGTVNKKGGMYNCILATTTKKKACEILGTTPAYMNDYWYCWTIERGGQDYVKKQALAQPDTPLYCHDMDRFKMDTIYKKFEELV